MQTWTEWQCEVVALLRHDLDDSVAILSLEDVDWPPFHLFYLEGRSARSAVNRALERDL